MSFEHTLVYFVFLKEIGPTVGVPKSIASRTARVPLVARHCRVLGRSRFRSPASSERAQEHAFQQPRLADTATEDEFWDGI